MLPSGGLMRLWLLATFLLCVYTGLTANQPHKNKRGVIPGIPQGHGVLAHLPKSLSTHGTSPAGPPADLGDKSAPEGSPAMAHTSEADEDCDDSEEGSSPSTEQRPSLWKRLNSCTAPSFRCNGSGWDVCDKTGRWQPGGTCNPGTTCVLNAINGSPYCEAGASNQAPAGTAQSVEAPVATPDQETTPPEIVQPTTGVPPSQAPSQSVPAGGESVAVVGTSTQGGGSPVQAPSDVNEAPLEGASSPQPTLSPAPVPSSAVENQPASAATESTPSAIPSAESGAQESPNATPSQPQGVDGTAPIEGTPTSAQVSSPVANQPSSLPPQQVPPAIVPGESQTTAPVQASSAAPPSGAASSPQGSAPANVPNSETRSAVPEQGGQTPPSNPPNTPVSSVSSTLVPPAPVPEGGSSMPASVELGSGSPTTTPTAVGAPPEGSQTESIQTSLPRETQSPLPEEVQPSAGEGTPSSIVASTETPVVQETRPTDASESPTIPTTAPSLGTELSESQTAQPTESQTTGSQEPLVTPSSSVPTSGTPAEVAQSLTPLESQTPPRVATDTISTGESLATPVGSVPPEETTQTETPGPIPPESQTSPGIGTDTTSTGESVITPIVSVPPGETSQAETPSPITPVSQTFPGTETATVSSVSTQILPPAQAPSETSQPLPSIPLAIQTMDRSSWLPLEPLPTPDVPGAPTDVPPPNSIPPFGMLLENIPQPDRCIQGLTQQQIDDWKVLARLHLIPWYWFYSEKPKVLNTWTAQDRIPNWIHKPNCDQIPPPIIGAASDDDDPDLFGLILPRGLGLRVGALVSAILGIFKCKFLFIRIPCPPNIPIPRINPIIPDPPWIENPPSNGGDSGSSDDDPDSEPPVHPDVLDLRPDESPTPTSPPSTEPTSESTSSSCETKFATNFFVSCESLNPTSSKCTTTSSATTSGCEATGFATTTWCEESTVTDEFVSCTRFDPTSSSCSVTSTVTRTGCSASATSTTTTASACAATVTVSPDDDQGENGSEDSDLPPTRAAQDIQECVPWPAELFRDPVEFSRSGQQVLIPLNYFKEIVYDFCDKPGETTSVAGRNVYTKEYSYPAPGDKTGIIKVTRATDSDCANASIDKPTCLALIQRFAAACTYEEWKKQTGNPNNLDMAQWVHNDRGTAGFAPFAGGKYHLQMTCWGIRVDTAILLVGEAPTAQTSLPDQGDWDFPELPSGQSAGPETEAPPDDGTTEAGAGIAEDPSAPEHRRFIIHAAKQCVEVEGWPKTGTMGNRRSGCNTLWYLQHWTRTDNPLSCGHILNAEKLIRLRGDWTEDGDGNQQIEYKPMEFFPPDKKKFNFNGMKDCLFDWKKESMQCAGTEDGRYNTVKSTCKKFVDSTVEVQVGTRGVPGLTFSNAGYCKADGSEPGEPKYYNVMGGMDGVTRAMALEYIADWPLVDCVLNIFE